MDLSQAAEFATRWAENQRGMVAVADALKSLGSMEQATSERKAALEAATKAHEAKQNEVKAAEKRLADLAAQHAAAEAAHTAQMSQMTKDAEARAARIVADAERRSKDMLEAARVRETQAQEAHDKAVGEMKAELDRSRQELAEIQTGIAATKADHGNLSAQIDAMKATARGLLA